MAMLNAGGASAGPAILATIVANGGGSNLSAAQQTARDILASGSGDTMSSLFAAALMTQSICGCRYPQFCSYCH
jgi:hypothetical protein